MTDIRLLNPVSPVWREVLSPEEYHLIEDAPSPRAIIVRSADMHGMALPETVLAVGRAGVGVNNIPLDEYPRRCINQIKGWKEEKESILKDGKVEHTRSSEYASYIMEAMVTGNPYKIGGNVLNTGLIDNLPADACVEVPCLVDKMGVNPCHVGRLPVQLAAMNMTNINAQLMTIKAARTRKREDIYRAAMLDPHTAAELSIDDIVKMCDDLIEAHGDYMAMYK